MSCSLLLCLVVASTGSQGRWEERVFDRSANAKGVNRLVARISAAEIRVVPSNEDTISVHAVRRAKGGTAADRQWYFDRSEIQTGSRNGDFVLEEMVNDDGKPRTLINFSMDSFVEIKVPRRLALELRAAAGGISVTGLEGAIDVQTTAGSIELRDIDTGGRPVQATTTAGSIAIRGSTGDIVARSSAGSVTVEGKVGDVKVRSLGDVRLNNLSSNGRKVEVVASIGGISAAFERVPSDEVRLTSGLGSVRLVAPGNSKARVNKEPAREPYPRSNRQTLEGEIGKTRIVLSTTMGSVSMTTHPALGSLSGE